MERARRGEDLVLAVVGELDLAGVDFLLDAASAACIDCTGEVVLDLTQLTFLDITGVRALMRVASRHPGRIRFLPAPPRLQRLFALTHTDTMLPFAPEATVTPFPTLTERNLRQARRIWRTWSHSGLGAALAMMATDVEWRPCHTDRTLRGPQEILDFYEGGERLLFEDGITFSSLGEDVLCRSSVRLDGNPRTLWAIWSFEGGMLRRSSSFESEAEALAGVARGLALPIAHHI